MSYGQQGSSQSSQSGLSPWWSNYFQNKLPNLFSGVTKMSNEAANDPGGLKFMPMVDKLLPIGRYGVPQAATEGTYQLGRDLWTQAAGNRTGRGFVSPENISGVLGDAVRMASGSLIPLATSTAITRAQMAPQLRSASLGYGLTPFDKIAGLISGSSQGQGKSSGFGFSGPSGEQIGATAALFP